MARSQHRRKLLQATLAGVTTQLSPFALAQPNAAGSSTGSVVGQEVGGSYVRLFPNLPAAKFAEEDLVRLACGDGKELIGMSAEPEVIKDSQGKPQRDANGHLIVTATAENEQDDEENFGLASGYTYLGQFIDHDLTLNPVNHFGPSVTTSTMPNLRSAAFDLDNIYGRGPVDQPYLYAADGRSLLNGRRLTRAGVQTNAYDHPRLQGRAVLGDKRNDENVLVSQMHRAFVAFHNKVVADHPKASFEEVRQIVTQHYQWMILTDFLPKLVGTATMSALLPDFGTGGKVTRTAPQLTIAAQLGQGRLPLEFTDAAYRLGHSLIRPVYRLNTEMRGTEQERRINPTLSGRRQIFAASGNAGLNGFRAYPPEWAIDWNLYFEVDRKLDLASLNQGPARVQAAYKIDTSLVNPLAFLPEFSTPTGPGSYARDKDGNPLTKMGNISNLAQRNLLRGQQHALPSGQDVARAMGIEPIATRDLMVGKATVEGLAENKSIAEYGDSFANAAPLWFYILAEAQYAWNQKVKAMVSASDSERNAVPTPMGPVGGQIVAQTFIALMKNDPRSILHANLDWRPSYLRQGRFDMPALLTAAGLV